MGTKWEYKVVDFEWLPHIEEELNNLGQEGWELVVFEQEQRYLRFILKRPIQAK